MKKIFKEAHKMTREMVEKYGVNYQVQFGLNLSYLLENKEEEEGMELIQKIENKNDFSEKDQQLVLANGRLGQWAAVIVGFDPKYKYERVFLEEDEIFNHFYCYNLKEGNIYNWSEGKEQYFGIVENGKLYNISNQDVNNLLNK